MMKRLMVMLVMLLSIPALADSVIEDWNDGSLNGWVANTGFTTVAWRADGGVEDTGYLFSQGSYGYVGALQNSGPYVGDYGAYGYNSVQCSLNFFSGGVTSAWFRVRYQDYSHNGWHIILTEDFSQGTWQTCTRVFNPSWSDAEAVAAGWVREATSATFAATMANALTCEVRILGSGYMEMGIDNFQLSDGVVPTSDSSWGRVKSLYR